ncbi:MAG TPA: hypothetical protein VFV38_29885 [Ktedonobacteraceae bacterium]|nr:hypothetical protein [Ktedonobacteraceae bacterium]
MQRWWDCYGSFGPDARCISYPEPREVVVRYRKLRGVMRADLAQRLKLTANSVCRLELYGEGLSKVSRLRQLQTLLDIPAVLLGLVDPPGPGEWWIAAGYPAFPAGDDGFPVPGAVVHHYRNLKCWKQADLADALDISEGVVRMMEKRNMNIDSLARRRAIQFLLYIPPALLGLDAQHIHTVPAGPTTLSVAPVLPSLEDIQSAQQSLWTNYYTGHGHGELQVAGHMLAQLRNALPGTSEVQRSPYLEQISLLYQAAGNVVLANANTSLVLSYMNPGIEYARLSCNVDLLSTALGRRAAALYELGEQEKAEASIREALFAASPGERVKRYPVAARVFSVSATDNRDRYEVAKMIDSIVVNDRYQNGVDPNIILWCRAQVLTNLAQNAPNSSRLLRQAADLLDRAEGGAPDTLRRKLIIKLEQARVVLGLREYDMAAALAIEAFQLMRQIKSVLYLPQLSAIYQVLLRSSFSSSPLVGRLGLLFFEVDSVLG